MKPTRKNESLQSRRRKKKLILLFKSLLSLLVLGGLITLVIVFFQGDYFRIKEISCFVGETSCTDEEKIIFADLLGENIFLCQTHNFTQKILEKYWQFEQVKIEKKLPHQIIVSLKTRQPFFNMTMEGKKWWLLDQQGFVLQEKEKAFAGLPQVFYSLSLQPAVGQKIEQETIQAIVQMLTSLAQEKLINYQKIMAQENVITLFTTDQLIASFSAQKNMQVQVDSLHFIVRLSKIEGKLPKFLDLRYDKPVVRF